jgi:hypothetical protein
MIGPVFAEFSKDYKNIHFIKVDVDELEDVSGDQGVEGISLIRNCLFFYIFVKRNF